MKMQKRNLWLHVFLTTFALIFFTENLPLMANPDVGLPPEYDELPKFVDGDVLVIEGAQPIRDKIAQINLGSVKAPDEITEVHRECFTFKIKRPKGAQANYPVSICFKLSHPVYQSNFFTVSKVGEMQYDSLTYDSEWDYYNHYTLDRQKWTKINFAPGETEKVVEMSYTRYPGDYVEECYASYFYQYLVFDLPEHTDIDYDCLILKVKNENYKRSYNEADDYISTYVHSPYTFNTDGKYLINQVEALGRWGQNHMLQVDPTTQFAVHRFRNDHENHEKIGQDKGAPKDSVMYVRPIEEPGEDTFYYTLIYKADAQDMAIDYYPWGNEIYNSHKYQFIHGKRADRTDFFDSPRDLSSEWSNIEAGCGSPVRPVFGAVKLNKEKYDKGERVIMSAELKNPGTMKEFYVNDSWLKSLDVTVDGGKTMLNTSPLYDEETKSVIFSFLAPESRADGKYYAEILVKENLRPWPVSIADEGFEYYPYPDPPCEYCTDFYHCDECEYCEFCEPEFVDRLVLNNTHVLFSVTNNTAKKVYTESIQISGMPTKNVIFFKPEERFLYDVANLTYTLSAKIFPANATFAGKWVSSNPEVATITETGVLTPLSAGTTQITFISDEVAYRQENGMSKNDAVLKYSETLTVFGEEDFPVLTQCAPSRQSVQENEPFYSVIINSTDWKTCGDAKVMIHHIRYTDDDWYEDGYTEDMFEPAEGIVKRKIPFSESFPLKFSEYPYEVKISIPMMNSQGYVYNAVCEQKISVVNERPMEITGIKNVNFVTENEKDSIYTDFVIHYIHPDHKFKLDISLDDVESSWKTKHYSYFARLGLESAMGELGHDYEKIPSWMTVTKDDQDDFFYMAKIHVGNLVEARHSYNFKVQVNDGYWENPTEVSANALYNILKPNLDDFDLGGYDDFSGTHSLADWVEDNSEEWKEWVNLFESGDSWGAAKLHHKLISDTKDFYITYPKTWGRSKISFDGEEADLTGDLEDIGVNVRINRSVKFPTDGKKHTVSFLFPEIGMRKDFAYTSYPAPEDLKNYYVFHCSNDGLVLSESSALKLVYTVNNYDEVNDTVKVDTIEAIIPLSESQKKARYFEFTFKSQGPISSYQFFDASDEKTVYSNRNTYVKSAWDLTANAYTSNWVKVVLNAFSQFTIIDEATGEPISDAEVRYCFPRYTGNKDFYISDYPYGNYGNNVKTGSYRNDGDGVYTLTLDISDARSFSYGYIPVEITKPGYMPVIVDARNTNLVWGMGMSNEFYNDYYKLLADNYKRTIILKRINNTCSLPYLAIGSKKNSVDYPIETNGPQLNSILRFNEEDNPVLYCYIPTDATFYEDPNLYSYNYKTPTMRLYADNMNYYILGNGTRYYSNRWNQYVWDSWGYYFDRSDARNERKPDLSKDVTGFTQSYKLYRFDLTGFIPGQKRDEGVELVKSHAWIEDATNNVRYEIPYLMNMSIDAAEYAKDVDITLPDCDVANKLDESTNKKGADTGFMSSAFKNFDIPVQGVLPFDINLKRENDYFILRGTYSQSFLPDGGLSEKFSKLQNLADAEEAFFGIKNAILGKTGNFNKDLSWFAMPSAFVGFRAYVEGRAGINPVTHTVDFGICGLGAKAEASGYFRSGFRSPLGQIGFSLSGELSAYLNLESAQATDLLEAGLDPRLTNVYDINIGSIVDFRASVFGEVGIDLFIFGAGVGFYGTAGANFECRDTFKPYYKDVNKALNGGIRFSVDASLDMYWWTKFLFFKKKHSWEVFKARKDYYYPANETNPLWAEDHSEVKTRSYLRSSVYKPYKRSRIQRGAKVLLRRIDSEAMPFYLDGGKSMAYLNINTASDPNDDKVQVTGESGKITLDGDDHKDNANFSLNASSNGGKSIVTYERSNSALDVKATEGTNEVLNIMNVATSSEIVASRNTSGTWVTETMSEDAEGKGNFAPKAAINESGKAAVVWNRGNPRFDDNGELNGISGELVIRTLDDEKSDIRQVIANNEKNRVDDYCVGMSNRGKSIVFCSVTKNNTDKKLYAVNDDGFQYSLNTSGQMLNILAINDSTFVGSALSTYKEDITTSADTERKYKEVNDIQLFKIRDNGDMESLGFLGLAGHNPLNVKLVGTGNTHGIDGLGVIWHESQKDEATGVTSSVMYGARVGYSDNKIYASCPQELHRLTNEADYISYFDGYMNDENQLVAAITVADQETDGSVVYEKTADFENKFVVYDADAQQVVNDGQSSIVVSVANEGFRPIDYVTVDVNGNETIVPVSIMPGCTANVTGYADAETDLNSNVTLNVNASFSSNISYSRSRAGARNAKARMKTSTLNTSSLSIATADMNIELLSSSTNEDFSSNALVHVVNKSKVRLKDDYKVTVGVYEDVTGEKKMAGVKEVVYRGKDFYTSDGKLLPQIAVFHIPAQPIMRNLFAIVKLTDKDGNEIKDITAYDNKLPITIYAQKTNSTLRGDANCDGVVDSKDGILIVSHYVGQDVEINLTNADANQDGVVDAKDAMWVAESYVSNYSAAAKSRANTRVKRIKKF